MDEHDAILFLKGGDLAGLAWLVETHQVRALRAAYLVTGDVQTAEDVVQGCFLAARRSIASFDPERPFAPWFLRCVLRAAVKAARKDTRQSSLDDEAVERLLVEALPSPESQVEAAEQRRRIAAALERLSPRQRAAVVQRYYLEMSEAEMSEALEAPRGTVKWLLASAREKLRRLLMAERRLL